MDPLPRLGKRELICLPLFTCNYVVSAWSGFLFLWVLGMGYVILLWHYLSLPYNYLEFGNEKIEVDSEFCYLGDILSAGGGCKLAAISCCKCVWGKFCQLHPLLTNRHLPLLARGKMYSSCVRSVMLQSAQTWNMKVVIMNCLQCNDYDIRSIYNVRARSKLAQIPSSQSLASRT